MTILVMRVLADNLSGLQPVQKMVIRHIDHLYRHEMSQKSELVSNVTHIISLYNWKIKDLKLYDEMFH